MNVYDFDETIYDGDSTRDFYFYCLKKDKKLLRLLPRQGIAFAKYLFGFITKTRFKEVFYSFLGSIEDIDSEVAAFWEKKSGNIKKWYLTAKRDDDLIISASPEFLLTPICKQLGVSLIASRVDKISGKTDGENCYGEEKTRRFYENIPKSKINKFYSDSLSDEPLARLSEKAFIVSGERLILWDEYQPGTLKRLRHTFFSKEFLGFIFVGLLNTFNGILFAMLFSLFLGANSAFICGYVCSLSVSYLLNSGLVFKEKMTGAKYLKFCLSYVPNFLIQNICVLILYNMLGVYKLFTYALAALIGVPLTFLLLKVFAFRGNQNE